MTTIMNITFPGGDLNSFLPIVVDPQETTPTSDLALEDLVLRIVDLHNSYNRTKCSTGVCERKKKGGKMDFTTLTSFLVFLFHDLCFDNDIFGIQKNKTQPPPPRVKVLRDI